MKITNVTARRLRIPLSQPIADSTHVLECIDLIVIEVQAGDYAGLSYMLSFDYGTEMLAAFVETELRRHVLGRDARHIRGIFESNLRACEYFGQSGIAMWGISAVDTALWDLLGKSLGCPAARLFGQCADAVPAYGSGGWLSYSEDQLGDELSRYMAAGFRAVKVKIGGLSLDWDVARVRLARQIVGPEVKLRVDANQALTVDRAIRTARQLEGLHVDWLEEPLPRADVGGYRQLAAATSIPLAAGEREYGLEPFDRLMEARAIAVVQPDLLRVGGVTGWRAVAARAEAAHLRIAPHFYREYDLHLAAACPNLIGIEWFSWLDDLLCVPPQLRDGLAVVPETPGFGVEFRRDAIAEYEVHR